MTFDEWLDEPQTGTTRRERFEYCLSHVNAGMSGTLPDLFREWLRAAWLAGAANAMADVVRLQGRAADIDIRGMSRSQLLALAASVEDTE